MAKPTRLERALRVRDTFTAWLQQNPHVGLGGNGSISLQMAGCFTVYLHTPFSEVRRGDGYGLQILGPLPSQRHGCLPEQFLYLEWRRGDEVALNTFFGKSAWDAEFLALLPRLEALPKRRRRRQA